MDLLWLSSLSFLTKKAFLLKAGKTLATVAILILPGAIPTVLVAAFLYKIYQNILKRKTQSLSSTNDQ